MSILPSLSDHSNTNNNNIINNNKPYIIYLTIITDDTVYRTNPSTNRKDTNSQHNYHGTVVSPPYRFTNLYIIIPIWFEIDLPVNRFVIIIYPLSVVTINCQHRVDSTTDSYHQRTITILTHYPRTIIITTTITNDTMRKIDQSPTHRTTVYRATLYYHRYIIIYFNSLFLTEKSQQRITTSFKMQQSLKNNTNFLVHNAICKVYYSFNIVHEITTTPYQSS